LTEINSLQWTKLWRGLPNT